MQIKINIQIFLFIIIFALTHQIDIYACIMIFSLIHEIGHMIAGIILKLKPKSLSFMPFGISLTFESYEYKRLIEIKKIFIALAGPLTNLIICIITFFLDIGEEIKQIIIYSNILITMFNLIPLYPLDGGRVLKGIIRLKCKEIKADKIVNNISNIVVIFLTIIASIGILYFKNIAILFVLMYLWIIVINENKKYSIKEKMYNAIKTNKCIDI
ncbi:MAG: hypothetical protein IJE59_01530 [Clostridia bacterium]|nr:hypothetical protein [Clostridia bacterium]